MSDNNFAVVFPGQGSQAVGMIAELSQAYPVVKDCFTRASDVLGYNLLNLVLNGPADKLNQTEYTQPALLAASYSIWNVFCSMSEYRPVIMAGHSLGEYSALVAAGSLKFEDAVSLVASRGRYMQEAVKAGDGAMAAILGLDSQAIEEVLNSTHNKQIVEIANLNANGQTVIAGYKEGVIDAMDKLKEAGAKLVKLLDVSVPSHCSLMSFAAEKLSLLFENIEFHRPNISVIHNYSLECYSDIQEIKLALTQQLTKPVRWVETIDLINKKGINLVFELGPGSVLTKLAKRINKAVKMHAVNDPQSLTVATDALSISMLDDK